MNGALPPLHIYLYGKLNLYFIADPPYRIFLPFVIFFKLLCVLLIHKARGANIF
jgi:hypothetical protein